MNPILKFSESFYELAEETQARGIGYPFVPCAFLGLSAVTAVGGVALAALKVLSDEVGLSKLYYSRAHQEFLSVIQILSEDNPELVADVKRYGADPEDKFAIAKICADKYPVYTANNFNKFGIINVWHILEVAICCATSDKLHGTCVLLDFKKFGFHDQQRIQELERVCREKSHGIQDLPENESALESSDVDDLKAKEAKKLSGSWERGSIPRTSSCPPLFRLPTSGPGSLSFHRARVKIT